MEKINKIIFIFISLSVICLLAFFVLAEKSFLRAVSSWQEIDLNKDGKIDATDIKEALKFYGCPDSGNCLAPTPTGQPSLIGLSFLYSPETLQFFPYLTNEKDYVDMLGANLTAIEEIHNGSIKAVCVNISLDEIRNTVAKLQEAGIKCDYLAYNAEDRPNATPPEEMHPYENYITSVKEAQGIAHGVGAVFVNGPGLGYMEEQNDRGRQLYKDTAPYVDIWMIQSQGYTTVGRTDQHVTPEQYRASVSEIADWIHEGNPNARIWVQIILSGGRLATNPLTAEEVVGYARAVEEIVDNVRVYLRGREGSLPPENLEKLRQIIEQLRSQGG